MPHVESTSALPWALYPIERGAGVWSICGRRKRWEEKSSPGCIRPLWLGGALRCSRASVEMQSLLRLPVGETLPQRSPSVNWTRCGSTTSFCADQLPVRPPGRGSERRHTTRSEDPDQTVSQQHRPHLPHLFLSVSPDPVNTNSAGTGLRLYCRCVAVEAECFRVQTFVVGITVVLLCCRDFQLLPPVFAVDQPELLGWPRSLLLCEWERSPRTLQSRTHPLWQDTILLSSPWQW